MNPVEWILFLGPWKAPFSRILWQGEWPPSPPTVPLPSVHPNPRSLLWRSLISWVGGRAPLTRILIHLQPSETSSCLEFGGPDLWMIPSCPRSSKASLLALLSLSNKYCREETEGYLRKSTLPPCWLWTWVPSQDSGVWSLYWSVNFLPTGLLN